MDFSWKRYFVVVTHHELILALDKASDVSDRIPLAEIERVEWEHAKDAPPRKRGDKRVRHAPEPGDSGPEARGRGQRGGGVCAGKVRRKVEKTKWKKYPKRQAEIIVLPDVDFRDDENDNVIMNRPMADTRLNPTPPDRWHL